MIAKGSDEAEAEFLAVYDETAFERPSLATDVVALGVRDGQLCALLTLRTEQPQGGRWALPGGFVTMAEGLDDAAARVLKAKGGLSDVYLEQLFTFGAPERDPRTRVVTVAYLALVDRRRLEEAESDQEGTALATLEIAWPGLTGGPVIARGADGTLLPLAFDHAEILGTAVQRLRGKLDYAPVGFELLPREFTLRQLQDIHEAILGQQLNKDSFRKRMLARGQLKATGNRQENVAYRPAELYRFVRRPQEGDLEGRNNG